MTFDTLTEVATIEGIIQNEIYEEKNENKDIDDDNGNHDKRKHISFKPKQMFQNVEQYDKRHVGVGVTCVSFVFLEVCAIYNCFDLISNFQRWFHCISTVIN